jgi:hypothetical protein
MKRDPFNIRSPFFRPVGRRAFVTGACIAWACVELSLGNPIWFVVFGAIGGYLGYQFFVVFDPKDYEAPKDDD